LRENNFEMMKKEKEKNYIIVRFGFVAVSETLLDLASCILLQYMISASLSAVHLLKSGLLKLKVTIQYSLKYIKFKIH